LVLDVILVSEEQRSRCGEKGGKDQALMRFKQFARMLFVRVGVEMGDME